MALPLVVHELADAEALDAYDWYAARDHMAAENFRSALLEAMDQIAERPELSPPFDGSVRRRLLHGFPYGVLYEAGADTIFVVAIMHLYRQPDY
jgi:plasmid stabilization system protein ParE